MSKFYIFDFPGELLEGLEPFKLNWGPQPTDAKEASDSESESSSSGEELEEQEEQNEGTEGIERKQVKPSKPSTFSSAVTKYNDEYEEESMEQWQWANRAHITGTPYVYFTNPHAIPDGKVLSIYKGWFDHHGLINSPVQEVQRLPRKGKSCVLMVGSGNFAGIIFDHDRLNHKANAANPFSNLKVLASKTFHRYTTRRKQGGAQSASDNARGKANSAGSTIRRANERMLKDEIQELLQSWSSHLADCHRIFFRAPGRSNKQLISGYAGAPISSTDPRLVTIPFETGQPTLNECKMAWVQLVQAQIADPPKPPVPTTQSSATQSSATQSKQSSPAPASTRAQSPAQHVDNEPSAEEQTSAKIVELIKRSKLPALKAVLDKDANGNLDFQLQPTSKYFAYPTPLLYAAHFDKHNVVAQLLNWGASPLVKNESGQTLGEISAPHKKTKEALQVARASLGESKWDWKAVRAGPPRTREQILKEDMKEKLRIRKENEEIAAKQEKEQHHERIERLIKKHGSGRLTGGLYEASRGLSEDELKHVERERRARAAEARLARFSGGS